MKINIKLSIFFLLFLFYSDNTFAGSFVYPFWQIADPKCRFTSWSQLWTDCKIDLPRISWADYSKNKENKTLRKVYSILRWSTYNYGWDVWYWSHLWVDIATSEWTPVRSIWDGEVIIAWWLNWRWNTVSIKHKLSDWRYIYSNYSHLSKIYTKKWSIKVGEYIGEVWNTGNSYGNHLHFQIDITNQSHPYWYTSCSKWISIENVVNNWQCRDYLTTNTIDPILFLESNWTFTTIENIQVKQKQTVKIEQKNIKTREQILDEEIQEFLRDHTFKYSTKASWDNLQTWLTYITKLEVFYRWKPFNWILPGRWIEFVYNNKDVRIFPENVIAIDKWSREINITWLTNRATSITFKLWKNILFTKTINFYKPWDLSLPTDATFLFKNSKMQVGSENMAAVVMKTKFGSNQINIPYNWTYKLKLLSGKAKMCNISKKSSKKCNPIDLATELEFRYEDTKAWILLFNIIASDFAPVKLTLTRVGARNDIAWMKWEIRVGNPLGLDAGYLYYEESISALKKWLIRLNQWYLTQDRELLWSQLKEIINNYLSYEYLRSWNNIDRKKLVLNKIAKFREDYFALNDYKKMTRWEMIKILSDVFSIEVINSWNVAFLDEKWDYKNYITTVRVNWFRWKDQFSDNYFQPDKNITIWESLYLIEKLKNIFII